MLFVLIDCNNFYVSCERLFDPKLNNKPVIILSNNDGCVISRSDEAKAMNIKMGEPYFKIQKFCREHGITVLSSNYQLYGDISNRIMDVLKDLLQYVEIYSIDEAFALIKANMQNIAISDIFKQMQYVKNIINQWLGIPISIGIGKTKTLAKLASHFAKQEKIDVFALLEEQTIESKLRQINVADIWGVGKKNAAKLNEIDIISACDLANTPPKLIRQKFGVVGERIVLELCGIPCFELEENPDPKKNIIVSRSFGTRLKNLTLIEEALANHASSACFKARKQKCKARGIGVFLKTSKHEIVKDYYYNSKMHWLLEPTSDTRLVIKEALTLLRSIYKTGYNYNKVGIVLLELIDINYAQGNLLSNSFSTQTIDPIMSLLDNINNKMGKNTVKIASEGVKNKNLGWQLLSLHKSRNYTTSWQELINILI